MKFSEFNLNENLQKALGEAKYENCTPVQEQVLKNFFDGNDLYVQSQTGTGKTCAFLIPTMQKLLDERKENENLKNAALIVVPTRELAVQVEAEAKKLGKYTGLHFASVYGGVGYEKQIDAIKKGIDVVIGTPGRIIDLCEGKNLNLFGVKFLVLDEADRMFDMGFYPDLRKILSFLGDSAVTFRKTMLFSATLNAYVKNLATEYTKDPIEITIEAENITVDEIRQELIHVSSDKKIALLLGIIQKEKSESMIIFSNTKKMCEKLSFILDKNGVPNEYIMGDLQQSKRLQIMKDFKSGKIKCLVATDVAARGIDVNDLQMVINFDLPNEAENYVHRIGRTARAGKSGVAYTLCTEQDVYSLMPIERLIEKPIPSRVAVDEDYAEVKFVGGSTGSPTERGKERGGRASRASATRKGSHGRGERASTGSATKGGKSWKQFKEVEPYGKAKEEKSQLGKDEFDKLSSMSADERMRFYKEKYGGGEQIKTKKPEPRKKLPEVPTGDKKQDKHYNKKAKKTRKKGVNSIGLRGLFHRIFGKK